MLPGGEEDSLAFLYFFQGGTAHSSIPDEKTLYIQSIILRSLYNPAFSYTI